MQVKTPNNGQGRPSAPRLFLLFGVVFLVALALRLIFLASYGEVPEVWDAASYWRTTTGIRNGFCDVLPYCEPTGESVIQFNQFFYWLVISRHSIQPFIFGIITTVLPAQPMTAHVFFAVFGAFVAVMIASIMIRLKLPHWVALAAGLAYALYVPDIVDVASYWQHATNQLLLVTTVWLYVRGFTAAQNGRTRLYILLGSIVLIGFGFSSATTRILIVSGMVLVILLGLLPPRRLAVTVTQGLILVGWLVMVAGVVFVGNRLQPDYSYTELAGYLFAGQSITEQRIEVTSPVTYEHFWIPSDGLYNTRQSISLFDDLRSKTGAFVYWANYSLVSNWRLPDTKYMQTFLLDVRGQWVQHAVIMILGLLGWAWLLGQKGDERRSWWLIFGLVLPLAILYSLIDVASRRFRIFMPFMTIGALIALWRLTTLRQLGVLVVGFLAAAAWLIPVAVPTLVLDVNSAYLVLTIIRAALTALFAIVYIRAEAQSGSLPAVRVPLLYGLLVLVPVVWYQFQDTDWRQWEHTTSEPVEQQISGAVNTPHLYPWLLIDVASPEQAAGLTIVVNDQTVKAAGEPMYIWEASDPPTVFNAFYTVARRSNSLLRRDVWYAYPLPRDLATRSTLDVQVTPGAEGFTIRGDYLPTEAQMYVGPLLSPWADAHSFWRWMWNGIDPRIPWTQPMNAAYATDPTVDLAGEFGKQTGVYRIFYVEAAITTPTNSLVTADQVYFVAGMDGRGIIEAPILCEPGQTVAAYLDDAWFVCYEEATGDIIYHTSEEIVATDGALYHEAHPTDTLVETFTLGTGEIELVQVMSRRDQNMFTATFLTPDGNATLALRYILPDIDIAIAD